MKLERPEEWSDGQPRADFIVPCYNEEGNVTAFRDAWLQEFEGCHVNWRLIMVDDGSSDATIHELEKMASTDLRIAVIGFSRNFGKEAAIYAGLQHSDADYIGIIDADLQQPPSVAREMLEQLMEQNDIDCVAAFQKTRKEGWLISEIKKKFYQVFAKASQSSAVENASDFRVFRRSVADALLSMSEYYRFSKGMFAWIGFRTLPWPYTPNERTVGESKWSFRSLLRYAFEGLLSFTTNPLHLITKVGVIVSLIAVVYTLVIIVRTLLVGVDLPGYASTICLILLFGGGQFFAIGIIGEYLGRTYIQGKHRPIYIVRERKNL